jgi:hypothetical protein
MSREEDAMKTSLGEAVAQSEPVSVVQPEPAKPDKEDKKVESFVSRLERDGFVVAEGVFGEFPLSRLCLKERSPLDCLYMNAASPYLAAFVPVDLGEREVWGYSGVVNSPLWRLRPDEAVVLVGLTPPPMRYFGLMGYLVKRYYPADEQGKAGYRTYFNNFGEQTNNLTIHTAGTPNGAPGDPYNSLFVYILTADRGIDARVREAASKAGFAPPIMNTEPMPQSLLRMGCEDGDDLFALVIRTAHPDDEQALADWKAAPPLRIFRITPGTEPPVGMSDDPFPIPDFRPHGTGQAEFGLLPAVEGLRQAILDKYSSPNLKAEEFRSQIWNGFLGGLYCLAGGVNCLGPSPNALYLWNADGIGTLGPDEFVIAYGVNHRLTGQAMYMSVSLYSMTKHITNHSIDSAGGDGDQLIGTAADYLPADYPDLDKLYAYKFARDCNEETNCFEVPFDWPGVRPDEVATLVWRAYLNPATKTGPDAAELIFDRAIKFSPMP